MPKGNGNGASITPRKGLSFKGYVVAVKETAGTVVFAQATKGGVLAKRDKALIPSLYLPKHQLPGNGDEENPRPMRLKITIEEE